MAAPIPLALAEKIGRYTEFRSAHLLDWHPMQRQILIGTRFADTTQVHQLKSPGGARTQLTFFADSVGGAACPPDSADYFIFSKALGGNERFQLYRYDLATGGAVLLTDGQARNSAGPFSHRGDKLAYTSTRRNGTDGQHLVSSGRRRLVGGFREGAIEAARLLHP